MDRRLTGLVALLAAALLVVGAAAAGRSSVPGVAAALPPDPPPAVGACVVEPFPGTEIGGPGIAPRTPAVSVGRCDTLHHGEVILVVDLTGAVIMDGTDECASSPDAYKFVGVDDRAVDTWVGAPDVHLVSIVPDGRQAAAGQQWVACAIGTRAGSPPYAGSLRDVYGTGTPPAALGSCTAGDDPLTGSRVACTAPHAAELFARYRPRETAPDDSTLARSCAALVAGWTGVPDLAAVPGLTVQVTREAPLSPDTGRGGLIACAVAVDDGRSLTGSLLSLGGDPLPWS
jgi:hypothetical protein